MIYHGKFRYIIEVTVKLLYSLIIVNKITIILIALNCIIMTSILREQKSNGQYIIRTTVSSARHSLITRSKEERIATKGVHMIETNPVIRFYFSCPYLIMIGFNF